MTLVKPIPKLLLPPIRTAQLTKLSEFVAIAHNLPISQDKSCTRGATGFDFACHWFNLNWHKIFKPITKCGNCIIVSLLSTVIRKLL